MSFLRPILPYLDSDVDAHVGMGIEVKQTQKGMVRDDSMKILFTFKTL